MAPLTAADLRFATLGDLRRLASIRALVDFP
jgi:hypothetical protein